MRGACSDVLCGCAAINLNLQRCKAPQGAKSSHFIAITCVQEANLQSHPAMQCASHSRPFYHRVESLAIHGDCVGGECRSCFRKLPGMVDRALKVGETDLQGILLDVPGTQMLPGSLCCGAQFARTRQQLSVFLHIVCTLPQWKEAELTVNRMQCRSMGRTAPALVVYAGTSMT